MNKIHFSALLCIVLLFTATGWGQVALIANKSVSISSIDKETVKNMYALDSKNLGTLKVVLFDIRDEGQTKTGFYNYIGTTPEAMRKIWLRAKLTGTGEPPTPVSEDEICNKVANTPGSIGYVSAAKARNNNVRVILNIE